MTTFADPATSDTATVRARATCGYCGRRQATTGGVLNRHPALLVVGGYHGDGTVYPRLTTGGEPCPGSREIPGSPDPDLEALIARLPRVLWADLLAERGADKEAES